MSHNKGFSAEQYAEAYQRLKSNKAVGREFGVDESVVRRALKGLAHRQSMEPEVVQKLQSAGFERPEDLHSGWVISKDENGAGVSAYFYNGKKDEKVSLEDHIDMVREAFASISPAKPVKAPALSAKDLLTVYPIADAHIGMLAWAVETGEDYDSKIASQRITTWMHRAVESSPPSDTAVIIDVGDLTHADDQKNMTPGSGHILDVDTRHFRTIEITIWTLAKAVESALAKHKNVKVVILKGNHDPNAYLTIMFALAAHFRNEPRVEVFKQPGDFFIYEFGVNMLVANHGDKSGPEKLVGFVAAKWPEMWGRTKKRYLFTGHKHEHRSKDIAGMVWEQLRAATAADYYAFSHAWVSEAQISGITYHREDGVKYRTYVGA